MNDAPDFADYQNGRNVSTLPFTQERVFFTTRNFAGRMARMPRQKLKVFSGT
jgi:hypothetical protein